MLPDTLALGPEVWRVLSKRHDMRNQTEYEGALDADDRLVSDLLSSVARLPRTSRACGRFRRSPSNVTQPKRLTAKHGAASRFKDLFQAAINLRGSLALVARAPTIVRWWRPRAAIPSHARTAFIYFGHAGRGNDRPFP